MMALALIVLEQETEPRDMAQSEESASSNESDNEVGFHSSKLGTKEYWDSTFDRDLQLYHETGDVGEVWFGKASVKRLTVWLEASSRVSRDHSVLDVGCGNGMTLVSLAKTGYSRLTGVDYSSSAVELAKAFTADEGLNITFEVRNLLSDDSFTEGSCLRLQYDICLDKGTYDAISLTPDISAQNRTLYKQSILRLVKPHGLFIITSCNWTESELLEQFSQDFELIDTIPTPSYQFGGATGNKETVCVFHRIETGEKAF